MEGVVSRSGKKLSTFEFERQNIAGCCKQTFHFQFNTKLIQSKTWFFSVFSVALPNGPKIQISLHYRILTPIPLLLIKSLGLYKPSSNIDFKRRIAAGLGVVLSCKIVDRIFSNPDLGVTIDEFKYLNTCLCRLFGMRLTSYLSNHLI